MPHKFLVHAKQDSVGVAVQDIRAGETLEGVVLQDESSITLKALQGIPLGHKIALTPLAQGAAVIKYGETIGRASCSRPGRGTSSAILSFR